MIPTDEPKVYKHPKVKFRYGVRKWKWIPFKNPARTDDAVFHHWRLANDESTEYPFAKFNKVNYFCPLGLKTCYRGPNFYNHKFLSVSSCVVKILILFYLENSTVKLYRFGIQSIFRRR